MWVGDVVAERFVIERPVASGGMGSVFYATDLVEGRPVAVKVMDHVHRAASDRFQREARVLSELAHPCLVRYVAHGETASGEPYLAMEWLEGEDLSQRLAAGRLPPAEATALVRRVADGLAQAHARGVVHRDVKPSNVFLIAGDARQAVLLDFAAENAAARAIATRTGTHEIQAPTLLAIGYSDAGRPDDAEGLIAEIPERLLNALLGHRADVHLARARIALARHAPDAAITQCDEGDAAAERWGAFIPTRHFIALSRAEALRLLGKGDDAHRTLRALLAEMDDLAARMDETTRSNYLGRGFPSARIRAVAREWGVLDDAGRVAVDASRSA